MTERQASRREHRRFCEVEGWSEVRNARGKPTEHHLTYELPLADGRILRTRISRPADSTSYGSALWSHILADQLQVSAAEFWQCVDERRPPTRHIAADTPTTGALPAGLAYQLVHTLHLSNDEIAALTIDAAVQLLSQHWSAPTD